MSTTGTTAAGIATTSNEKTSNKNHQAAASKNPSSSTTTMTDTFTSMTTSSIAAAVPPPSVSTKASSSSSSSKHSKTNNKSSPKSITQQQQQPPSSSKRTFPSSSSKSNHTATTTTTTTTISTHSLYNLTLLDPPKYGWCASGGIISLLEPHEHARRTSTKLRYEEEQKEFVRRKKRARQRELAGERRKRMKEKQSSSSSSSESKIHDVEVKQEERMKEVVLTKQVDEKEKKREAAEKQGTVEKNIMTRQEEEEKNGTKNHPKKLNTSSQDKMESNDKLKTTATTTTTSGTTNLTTSNLAMETARIMMGLGGGVHSVLPTTTPSLPSNTSSTSPTTAGLPIPTNIPNNDNMTSPEQTATIAAMVPPSELLLTTASMEQTATMNTGNAAITKKNTSLQMEVNKDDISTLKLLTTTSTNIDLKIENEDTTTFVLSSNEKETISSSSKKSVTVDDDSLVSTKPMTDGAELSNVPKSSQDASSMLLLATSSQQQQQQQQQQLKPSVQQPLSSLEVTTATTTAATTITTTSSSPEKLHPKIKTRNQGTKIPSTKGIKRSKKKRKLVEVLEFHALIEEEVGINDDDVLSERKIVDDKDSTVTGSNNNEELGKGSDCVNDEKEIQMIEEGSKQEDIVKGSNEKDTDLKASNMDQDDLKDPKSSSSHSNETKNRIVKLDPFVYHRGRDGQEHRDKNTGELCCPTDPTDTNHDWDEPNLKFKVNICFPLVDTDDLYMSDDDRGGKDKEHPSNSMNPIDLNEDFRVQSSTNPTTDKDATTAHPNPPVRRYARRSCQTKHTKKLESMLQKRLKREAKIKALPHLEETIDWDLSDPTLRTPLVYASDVAAEYGLSLNQTLDLARSIQEQIDAFVRSTIHYKIPISKEDPFLNPRSEGVFNPPEFKFPKILHGGHGATNIVPKKKDIQSRVSDDDNDDTESSEVENEKEQQTARKSSKNSSGRRKSGGTNRNSTTKNRSGGNRKKSGAPVVKHSRGYGPLPFDQIKKHDPSNFGVGKEYAEELIDRLSKATKEKIAKLKSEDGGSEPYVVRNHNCHICHTRKPECLIFPCGNERHAYCDLHTCVSETF